MQIVFAEAADLPEVVAISNWAAEHTTANFATEPEPVEDWRRTFEQTRAMYPWLVAKEGGRVVAFAKASPHRARGAYAWSAEVSVYVQPDHHRKGVGRRLYERLFALLEAQGYVTLLAGITSPHPASEGLHAALGFTRCATFHRVGWKFGRWHDVGYWEKQLAPADRAPRALRPVAEVA